MMRLPTRLLACAAIIAAGPAFAQAPASPAPASPSAPASASLPPAAARQQQFMQRFEAANTTHDGRLTLAQAQAGHMPRIARYFSQIDTAGKGYVTVDDLRAFRRTQVQARKAPNGGTAGSQNP